MKNKDDHPDPENTSRSDSNDSSTDPASFDANKTVNHAKSKKTIKLFLDPDATKPLEPGEKPGRKTIQFRKAKTVDLTELEQFQLNEQDKTISIIKGKTVQVDTDDDSSGLMHGGLLPSDNRKTLDYLSNHKTIQLPETNQDDYSDHDSFELALPGVTGKRPVSDTEKDDDSSSATIICKTTDFAKTWGPLPDVDSRSSLQGPDKDDRFADVPILNDRVVIWDAKEIPPGNPDYQITSFLGEGAMGQVYVAKQISVDRDVAFKVQIEKPGLDHGSRQQQINKFLFEAKLTASLDHPNIVGVHDMGRDQTGQVFYCMELVRGTPWESVMGDMSLESNLDLLVKVINGVSYAHSKNTIHRDLKPENVMLGSFGEVLIMDWGLGVNLDDGPPVTMGGTPGFMAPEMARPPESATGKHSDIYVLGAILFFIITGETPHRGDDVWECLEHAEQNLIVDVSSKEQKFDQRLMAIALRAMATNPKDRYRTADDLKQAIKDSQSNRLSVKLTRRSKVELKRATKQRSYERFSKSMFGFREALDLWPENEAAEVGLKKVQLAYAETALERNDFELGMSLLDSESEEDAFLLQKLRKSANAAYRRKRLVWLAVGSSILLLAALVATALLNARTERIYAENLQAAVSQEAKAKVEAQVARLRAETERRRAESLLAENELEKARSAEEDRKKWFKVFDQGNNDRVFATVEKTPLNSAEYDHEGTMVLLGDESGALRIGKRNANGKIQSFNYLNSNDAEKPSSCIRAKFADNTNQIVSFHDDGSLVVRNLANPNVSKKIAPDEGRISDFDVSLNDDRQIATVSSTGQLTVHDLNSANEIYSVETKRELTAVNFSSGALIAASKSGDLLVFDVKKKSYVTIKTSAKNIAAIRNSANGSLIAILDRVEDDDGEVQYWRQVDGEWKMACKFGSNIKSIEIAPDGKRVFTGNAAGALTVWSITDDKPESPRKLISLHDHDDAISHISMSADGQRLVSSSLDGSIIFWLRNQ